MTSRVTSQIHPSVIAHQCGQIDLPAPLIVHIPDDRADLTPDFRIAAALQALGITADVTALGKNGRMAIRLDSANAARVADRLENGHPSDRRD